MTELFTLGRDAVLRQAGANNTSVCNLALAYQYGRQKDQSTGKLPTQWVEGTLWGARAEALAQYLTKGTKVVVTLEHIHMAPGRDKGDGTTYPPTIKGEVIAITLAGSPQQSSAAQAPAPPPRPPAPAPRPAPAPTGFADMDSDIPFIVSLLEYDVAPSKARRLARCEFN
jgi:single-strand DNA-binding protein